MGKLPYLIFELGKLQVFTYRTPEEYTLGDLLPYTIVFWQDTVSKNTYGPFDSINAAMTHYTQAITSQKARIIGVEENADIITVDFKSRKRVN